MVNQVPDWFYASISTGLQALIVLHLPGAPGHETVAYTEDVWVEVLWTASIDWQETQDVERLRRAFLGLARRSDRWPAPRALLEQLPARAKLAQLPAPRMSKRDADQARQRLAEIMESLAKGKKAP
ncbi:hypothetical protein [Eoetvoesiella caeni]